MAENKRMVEEITSMDDDFAKWYTDIVLKAELVDYSSVRGCVILRPYAYAIWENIQKLYDTRFKETGHENVYMPMFIPESLLNKEKDHVEGFAPEVAWVTHGGSEKLAERLCVRPTSETLFCEHYANTVRSWRDLPKLYNQWCSVVRWEKSTRPFLRSREFLWQEGHTIHETETEAREETLRMLDIYVDIAEKKLGIPMISGRKTDREKFAGALETYTMEALMHDGKALQSGTSHYFGDGFARAFGIQFADRQNNLAHPHQTSWGLSTRLIGGIIMCHGDDSGLVLPPAIAPIQVVIVPVAAHKGGVMEAAQALSDRLRAAGIRVKLDDSDQSPGWKFAQYEMKGVPLRIEIGPRDIEKGQCVIVERLAREKEFVPLDALEQLIPEKLDALTARLYDRALKNREARSGTAYSIEDMKAHLALGKGGFVRSMWCGSEACEERVKAETGMPSRCIPFEQEHLSDHCAICGAQAKHMVYWAVSY